MSRAHELAQRLRSGVSHLGRGYFSLYKDVGELERIAADAERYREALERVYQIGRGPHVEIARAALNDFEQGGTGAILDGSVAGAAKEDDNR